MELEVEGLRGHGRRPARRVLSSRCRPPQAAGWTLNFPEVGPAVPYGPAGPLATLLERLVDAGLVVAWERKGPRVTACGGWAGSTLGLGKVCVQPLGT